MPETVIAIAEPADGPALAALRRAWTAESGTDSSTDVSTDVSDEGFEARFADWYERESARRVTWLARISGDPVGMMNLAVFERMPAPGRDAGTWGYLARPRRRPRLCPRRAAPLRPLSPVLPPGRLHREQRLASPRRLGPVSG